jgi:UDP-2,3-diacylglucosamine pyrophosphatase LpxH
MRPNATDIRTLFISDIHLGSPHAKPKRLLELLSQVHPETVYLVGDFIDGWELRRRWKWGPEINQVIRRLVEFSRRGTTVRYVIGNHDDFLRHHAVLSELVTHGGIAVADEFTHETIAGKRYLVVHGDRFDEYGSCSASVDWLMTILYSAMLKGNDLWQFVAGGQHGMASSKMKSCVGPIVRQVQRFRSLLVQHARERGFDGVICGHIHAPEQLRVDGIDYLNTGDWLENCSAILEHADGRFELCYFSDCRGVFKLTVNPAAPIPERQVI